MLDELVRVHAKRAQCRSLLCVCLAVSSECACVVSARALTGNVIPLIRLVASFTPGIVLGA